MQSLIMSKDLPWQSIGALFTLTETRACMNMNFQAVLQSLKVDVQMHRVHVYAVQQPVMLENNAPADAASAQELRFLSKCYR